MFSSSLAIMGDDEDGEEEKARGHDGMEPGNWPFETGAVTEEDDGIPRGIFDWDRPRYGGCG